MEKKPLELLQQIITRSSIVDIFMLNSNFELKMHPVEVVPERCRIALDTTSGFEFSNDKKFFICHVKRTINSYLEMDEKLEDGKPKEILAFTMSATFSAVYSFTEGENIQESAFAMFSETNAEYNTHTYFREFFHSTCSRAGIHPFVMPFFKPLSSKAIEEKYKDKI